MGIVSENSNHDVGVMMIFLVFLVFTLWDCYCVRCICYYRHIIIDPIIVS